MTTLPVAAWACGAVAVIAVARKSAARTAVNSDRILLLDALWAPLLSWGNRLASSLPETTDGPVETVGVVAVDGETKERRGTCIRLEFGAGRSPGRSWVPGGEPPEGDRMPAVTTALRLLGLSAIGWST